METLLAKTHDVFEEPSSLPPPRTLDHSITLKSGTEPFNRRPYRYSYTQKNEIDRIIVDLFKNSIIQPSTSPFAAPALLFSKEERWKLENVCGL